MFGLGKIGRKKESEEDRIKGLHRSLAYSKITDPLYRHLLLLYYLYKTTITKPPEPLPETFTDLFGPSYFRELRNFDPLRNVPSFQPHSPDLKINWVEYLSDEFRKFKNLLEGLLDQHMAQINVQMVAVMDEILNSYFLEVMCDFGKVHECFEERYREILEGEEAKGNSEKAKRLLQQRALSFLEDPHFRFYTLLLIQFVELHNDLAAESRRIYLRETLWRKEAPPMGSCRIAEEADPSS